MVEQQGHGQQQERCLQRQPSVTLETHQSETQSPGNATLPPEHECALRRAALTMPAQFDEEQQEARADESKSEADKHGSRIPHNLLGARQNMKRCATKASRNPTITIAKKSSESLNDSSSPTASVTSCRLANNGKP